MTIATGNQILAADIYALFEKTAIPFWGTIAEIPDGFIICDGNNDTPNLLTRFLEGVATAATNPGTTGGATAKNTSTVTGTKQFAVEHSGAGTDTHSHSITDIRPLFYDVAFITAA
jgi:hypothetical protein